MLERFKDKFRVQKDECGDLIIPLRGKYNGLVYEYNDKTLGIQSESSKPMHTFNTIKAKWPKLKPHQMCDEFSATYRFDSDKEAEQFLRSIGAKTKRKLSDEQKAASVERLAQFAFKKPAG